MAQKSILPYRMLKHLKSLSTDELKAVVSDHFTMRTANRINQYDIAIKMKTHQSIVSAIENHSSMQTTVMLSRYINAIREISKVGDLIPGQ